MCICRIDVNEFKRDNKGKNTRALNNSILSFSPSQPLSLFISVAVVSVAQTTKITHKRQTRREIKTLAAIIFCGMIPYRWLSPNGPNTLPMSSFAARHLFAENIIIYVLFVHIHITHTHIEWMLHCDLSVSGKRREIYSWTICILLSVSEFFSRYIQWMNPCTLRRIVHRSSLNRKFQKYHI